MQTFEIALQNTAAGWHWSVADTSTGTAKLIADSFTPSRNAADAAAEAEAEIAEPGRAARMYRAAA